MAASQPVSTAMISKVRTGRILLVALVSLLWAGALVSDLYSYSQFRQRLAANELIVPEARLQETRSLQVAAS